MGFVLKRRATYKVDNTGLELSFPVLITEHGVLISLLRYFYENRSKSESWFERSTFSIRLLIEYLEATSQLGSALSSLRNFVAVLNLGSMNNGIDETGLFWKPRTPQNVSSILDHINKYTDWLSESYQTPLINSFKKADTIEKKLSWSAYCNKRAKVFLNHLMPIRSTRIDVVRRVKSDPIPLYAPDHANKFPENRIEDLLGFGFIEADLKTKNIKNILITILLHYGGLRISEPFHIYTSDILFDEKTNEAIVRVHHPEFGLAPDGSARSRKEYLNDEFGLMPRNKYPKSKRFHSGWKSPLLTNRAAGYFEVFFTNNMASHFFNLWVDYLKYQRESPRDGCIHPYAFTNSKGTPETVKNFRRAHRAAIEKIGLTPSKVSGCSPHGHRHSYGYRLSKYGFSNVEIQKAMHHKSPDSCLIYTQPSNSEVRSKMREVE